MLISKEDLKRLQKDMDDFHDKMTEIEILEEARKHGFKISDELIDELESEENGIPEVPKKPNGKKRGNRGYNNQGTRKRG